MTIESIRGVKPVEVNSVDRNARVTSKVREGDTVSISTEAMEKADFMRAFEIVSAAPAPEVRADRVAELRARINDPAYFNDAVFGGAADDVMNLLGF